MAVPPKANTDSQDAQTGAVPASQEKIGTFASLRVRNFRFLLIGTTLSNAAQWIQQVTLNWLVYDLSGSGTLLGTINLVRSAASLGLSPMAGVAIDRLSRRMLMVALNGWLFVISLGLGVLLIFGHSELWYLFVFTFLAGVAQAFDMPLRQTVIFDLVPRSFAPNAVALVWTGWAVMRSIGPAIGGLLILWFGPGGNFLVQAVAYSLVAVTIYWIHFPPRTAAGHRMTPLKDIGEGIRYVAKERVTRTFMLMWGILPLFIIPNFSALLAIYAKDVFEGGPETLGFLLSAVGVGGIVGGVFTASLGRLERRGLVQLASLLLTSLPLIGFAFSHTLLVALPFLAVAGCFEMVYISTNQTLLQLSIPDHMRGRITSIIQLNTALFPLGAFFAGLGSDLLGGPSTVTVIICGIAAGLAALIFFASPTVREYRLSKEIARGPSPAH